MARVSLPRTLLASSTALVLTSAQAQATGLSTVSARGTSISSPAEPDQLAPLMNPALLARAPSLGVLLEGNVTQLAIDIETSRHEGIDPNTGELYPSAQSSVLNWQPNSALAASWQAIPDRVGIGFSVSQPMRFTVDFLGDETNPPPFTGPQRYSAIQADSQSIALGPSLGVHLWDGLHVGGTVSLYLDRFEILRAWDAMGTEGLGPDDEVAGQLNPYTGDAYFLYSSQGHHFGGGVGLFFDRWEPVQLGVTWTHMGRFQTSGTGRIDFPALLGIDQVPLLATTEMALPQVLRAAVRVQLHPDLAGVVVAEQTRWGDCCGSRSGDIHLQITDENGDSLGPEHGISVEIPIDQYSPRRLQDTLAIQLGALGDLGDATRIGAGVRWQQSAVPDFAISATNLDMETWSVSLFCERRMEPFSLGLHGLHVFPASRTITHSAWDVRVVSLDDDNADYVDERFSPQLPFTASSNGTYDVALESLVLRLAWER